MATIAIFGGTGYAGGAIRDEALRRGHTVIAVSRKEAGLADRPGLISRAG
jgi:putative NADH-flavin reductase